MKNLNLKHLLIAAVGSFVLVFLAAGGVLLPILLWVAFGVGIYKSIPYIVDYFTDDETTDA